MITSILGLIKFDIITLFQKILVNILNFFQILALVIQTHANLMEHVEHLWNGSKVTITFVNAKMVTQERIVKKVSI